MRLWLILSLVGSLCSSQTKIVLKQSAFDSIASLDDEIRNCLTKNIVDKKCDSTLYSTKVRQLESGFAKEASINSDKLMTKIEKIKPETSFSTIFEDLLRNLMFVISLFCRCSTFKAIFWKR